MASSSSELCLVDLLDPTSNKTYTIQITSDEFECLQKDPNLVNLIIQEAKDAELAQAMSDQLQENSPIEDPRFDDNDLTDNTIEESQSEEQVKNANENSVFLWSHAAILLLVEEYRKLQTAFTSGKHKHVNLWKIISDQLHAHGHNVSGPQCQSKFAGMKKTYKKTKDANSKSGNSAHHWPYTALMDELMGDKPFMSPVSTCSSTGKKRTLSEDSNNSNANSDPDNLVHSKKARITPTNHLITILEERAKKIEENKDRRFREFMAFKTHRAKEDFECKQKALQILEKFVNSSNNL